MMPTMPPDSHKISLKIIEAIRQHPVLYVSEVKGPTVKLQDFRQKVWKHISDELGLDPGWVRLRWKNLRDTYCRILKYKVKSDKGVRRKKWIFEDHLSFLKFPSECVELTEEYIQRINDGGISSEGLLEQLEDRNDEDYNDYLEVLEETTADPVANPLEKDDQQYSLQLSENDSNRVQDNDVDAYAQQIQSKYRKIRPKRAKLEQKAPLIEGTSVLKSPCLKSSPNLPIADGSMIGNQIFVTSSTLLSATSSPIKAGNDKTGDSSLDSNQTFASTESKSSIELFFESMAQTVKRLPPKAQADVKMNICKIVTEAEVKYSVQNMTQGTQQFIAPPGMIPKLVLIPCNMIDNQSNKG
ncbi:uncharacterized protein LOC105696040 [Orussus abietinus]|uniref:uncharacterized protein LOC105696040 n=1 Tax=Orussus abietinus TaxID=222816 RepID=UPI0006258A40|nr:uncharacterized protein LOC105696040 [Orussus abietinus]XP_012273603.1 uncharacterized protein LOC105696040 [Orussus abietinus]XP_012273604.1 uncharacterized protein LOC105696040 [Orussus abietinus]